MKINDERVNNLKKRENKLERKKLFFASEYDLQAIINV